jgi:hypothetical protein
MTRSISLASTAWRCGWAQLLIDSRGVCPRQRTRACGALPGSAAYGRKEIGLDVSAQERRAGCPVSHDAVRDRHTDRSGAIRQGWGAKTAHLLDAIEHDALTRRRYRHARAVVTPIAMRGHSGSSFAPPAIELIPSALADGTACTVIPLTKARTDSATTRRRRMIGIMGQAYVR